MSWRWPWSKPETRQAQGFTSEIIAARQQFFSGSRGVAEATATVEACVSLWERAFTAADVSERWRSIITPARLALIGRSLAKRGQFVGLVDSSGSDITLTPAVDWDASTRRGEPIAYRIQVPEAGGGFEITALADEVVDIRINVDPTTPWHGQSPLRKARLTADILEAIETGLGDVVSSPWGAQVVPMPRLPNEAYQHSIRDLLDRLRFKRGGLVMYESTQVMNSSTQTPRGDWDNKNLTPNINGLELPIHWEAVRNGVLAAYGIPPILFSAGAQSAALREGQRHAVLWSLAPVAKVASAELARKLDDPELSLDLTTPLQAADSAGRARAVGVLVGTGMALDDALALVGWNRGGSA